MIVFFGLVIVLGIIMVMLGEFEGLAVLFIVAGFAGLGVASVVAVFG